MISANTRHQLYEVDPARRQLAAKKIGLKVSAESSRLIRDRLELEEDPEVLEWLLIGVRQQKVLSALPRVTHLLQTPMHDVRRFACEAIGHIGDGKSIAKLGALASDDADYQVRFAAIAALESIGLRDVQAAVSVVRELDDSTKRLQTQQDSRGSQDLARAAQLASGRVDTALRKQVLPALFDIGYLSPIDITKNSKTKILDQITLYLQRQGAEVSEVRYVVNVTRTIVRKSSVVHRLKSTGITACQLCDEKFFPSKSGKLYCQVAHINALQDGGRDSIDNTLLLCAGCHAQMDMAKDAKVTIEGQEPKILHVMLPSGAEKKFELREGQRPKRLT